MSEKSHCEKQNVDEGFYFSCTFLQRNKAGLRQIKPNEHRNTPAVLRVHMQAELQPCSHMKNRCVVKNNKKQQHNIFTGTTNLIITKKHYKQRKHGISIHRGKFSITFKVRHVTIMDCIKHGHSCSCRLITKLYVGSTWSKCAKRWSVGGLSVK